MKKKQLKAILLGFVLCLVIYIFATTISIYTYSLKDEKCVADVAIVLGAGATDKGVLPVYRERINHGIWLYKNGYVSAIILTGGIGKGNINSDASIAKQYAIEKGIQRRMCIPKINLV